MTIPISATNSDPLHLKVFQTLNAADSVICGTLEDDHFIFHPLKQNS
jgi:hypothetical protein